MRTLTIVALLGGLSSPAIAVTSGNDFHQACADEAFCYGYIMGVIDGVDWQGRGMEGGRGKDYCPPAGSDSAQARDIVLKYIDDHPEQRHLPTPALIIAYALKEAWPC